jgi:hypothetical protein
MFKLSTTVAVHHLRRYKTLSSLLLPISIRGYRKPTSNSDFSRFASLKDEDMRTELFKMLNQNSIAKLEEDDEPKAD